MNELKIFKSNNFGEIRTLMINDEPYFVGKDVAKILGYQNHSKALDDHVEQEDKLNNKSLSSLGQRGGWLINESGLYSLILSSKLPKAKQFKQWVTSEVLPSIRKHGAYMTDETLEKALTSPDFLIKLATELKVEKEKRIELEGVVEEQRPKVLFANAVETSNTSILIGDFAKILKQNGVNIGQNKLFAWLRENGYLISRKGDSYNMPTQKSMERKLFEIKERTHNNPVIFAFTLNRLNEQLEEKNLKYGDIIQIENGAFMAKNDTVLLDDFLKKDDEIRKEYFSKDENILDALVYEFSNYEMAYRNDRADAIEEVIEALQIDLNREEHSEIIEKALDKYYATVEF